ncbi:MAG: metal ABC transporter ATP-binding protein, partial [Thermoguttaceae bacterium]
MTNGTENAWPTSVVAFRNVSFFYGAENVLEGVSFCINHCDSVCIVGPNGGGKTTILILGLLKPTAGEISVFGQSPWQARLNIGYMPQHVLYDPQFPATVMDIVLMGRLGQPGLKGFFGWPGRSDHQAAEEALKQVEMQDFSRRSFAALSGGQRQRVLVARALCT